MNKNWKNKVATITKKQVLMKDLVYEQPHARETQESTKKRETARSLWKISSPTLTSVRVLPGTFLSDVPPTR